jgi:hypothetical protein
MSIDLKPFQGLKPDLMLMFANTKLMSIDLKPFQGLKPVAMHVWLGALHVDRPQTLSGIETRYLQSIAKQYEMSIDLKPFQGLKKHLLSKSTDSSYRLGQILFGKLGILFDSIIGHF